ncbi:MAG: hypothetical protein PHE12_03965 [Clostridia bacterium]|nr:hypothetical protein [Clostridia bacterium]
MKTVTQKKITKMLYPNITGNHLKLLPKTEDLKSINPKKTTTIICPNIKGKSPMPRLKAKALKTVTQKENIKALKTGIYP